MMLQHFNAYLPLNKRMRYYSPDYPSMGFVQVFRVSPCVVPQP